MAIAPYSHESRSSPFIVWIVSCAIAFGQGFVYLHGSIADGFSTFRDASDLSKAMTLYRWSAGPFLIVGLMARRRFEAMSLRNQWTIAVVFAACTLFVLAADWFSVG